TWVRPREPTRPQLVSRSQAPKRSALTSISHQLDEQPRVHYLGGTMGRVSNGTTFDCSTLDRPARRGRQLRLRTTRSVASSQSSIASNDIPHLARQATMTAHMRDNVVVRG